MCLEEQVRLDVRVIIPRVGKLEGHTGGELPQKGVLLVPDGRFSYSAAEERISMRPFSFVLLLSDMLKSSRWGRGREGEGGREMKITAS